VTRLVVIDAVLLALAAAYVARVPGITCRAVFPGYRVSSAGPDCSPAELDRRERARGDRTAGQSAARLAQVHVHGIHDLAVDTKTTSPGECAVRVRGFLARHAGPTVFDRLRVYPAGGPVITDHR